MPYGYNGKILRVNLSSGRIWEEHPEEDFYRRYFGGRGFISYYLLKELKPGIDPLGPDNPLIFAAGLVTGVPVGGCGRNSVGARSPLTSAYGDAEAGGYWGAELKAAGYDAIIIEGRSSSPVYLWLHDSQAEIRNASHLWGKPTARSQALIHQELGDPVIRTAQIGSAGERLVRYACIMNDLSHVAGRTGMGAVMGSKNLKAVAVRGHHRPSLADAGRVADLARWLRDNAMFNARQLHELGTAGLLMGLNSRGGLPTRNFHQGVFEGAGNISGERLRDTILVRRGSCFACPVRCKPEVALSHPHSVDPVYGGPEYETLASLGSNCGIDDLAAIARGNQLCNSYGLDTISTGAAIAFAMECFEQGILTQKDADGLELRFGNSQAMLELIEKIARRQGLGDILAEGVARAAQHIGRGAAEVALHIKGQELPLHEPRYKQGLGLGYAVSPTGADHCHNIHDSLYTGPGPQLEDFKTLGILEPLPTTDLSPAKVRMVYYIVNWRHLQNCLVFCYFVPLNFLRTAELVQAVTGWNTSVWELMKVGERCAAMTRAFNCREGFSEEDDRLPERFFTPFTSGPLQGVSVDREKLREARDIYYGMAGWTGPGGMPTLARLYELGIGWVADAVKLKTEYNKTV